MNFLFPSVNFTELKLLVLPCLVGAVVASLFGVVNDQVMFGVSPEYFSKLKYHQFSYLQISTNHRFNIGLIGIMGTWWVGIFSGWFIGRWHLMASEQELSTKIYKSYVVIFTVSFLALLLGYALGGSINLFSALPNVVAVAERFGVLDTQGFLRVAFVHYFGYAGGLLGLCLAMFLIKRGDKNAI